MTFISVLSFTFANAKDRYHEADGGFSYKIPAGWSVKSFGSLKYKVVITDPVRDFTPNITILDETYPGDLAEYVQANIPYMEKTIKGFRIISEGAGKTTDGHPFATVSYVNQIDMGELIQTAFFMEIIPGLKLVITCTPPPGKQTPYINACTEMVRSIKLE